MQVRNSDLENLVERMLDKTLALDELKGYLRKKGIVTDFRRKVSVELVEQGLLDFVAEAEGKELISDLDIDANEEVDLEGDLEALLHDFDAEQDAKSAEAEARLQDLLAVWEHGTEETPGLDAALEAARAELERARQWHSTNMELLSRVKGASGDEIPEEVRCPVKNPMGITTWEKTTGTALQASEIFQAKLEQAIEEALALFREWEGQVRGLEESAWIAKGDAVEALVEALVRASRATLSCRGVSFYQGLQGMLRLEGLKEFLDRDIIAPGDGVRLNLEKGLLEKLRDSLMGDKSVGVDPRATEYRRLLRDWNGWLSRARRSLADREEGLAHLLSCPSRRKAAKVFALETVRSAGAAGILGLVRNGHKTKGDLRDEVEKLMDEHLSRLPSICQARQKLIEEAAQIEKIEEKVAKLETKLAAIPPQADRQKKADEERARLRRQASSKLSRIEGLMDRYAGTLKEARRYMTTMDRAPAHQKALGLEEAGEAGICPATVLQRWEEVLQGDLSYEGVKRKKGGSETSLSSTGRPLPKGKKEFVNQKELKRRKALAAKLPKKGKEA